MENASLAKIRKELETCHPTALQHLLVRLMKYKKENKELVAFLLFEADDRPAFVAEAKRGMDADFAEIGKSAWFPAKKRLQKTIRVMGKYIKFADDRRTEAELRVHFCLQMRRLPQTLMRQRVIAAIFMRQVDLARKCIGQLHEDLQFDYGEELKKATER